MIVTFHPSFHLTNTLIGWFNLIQEGYLHRDISIGNLVMVEDAITTKAFGIVKKEDWNTTVEDITKALQDLKIDSSAKATWEDKLTAALRKLRITDKCHGFLIDGDMAIKMTDYFNKEHPGSCSVRWNVSVGMILICMQGTFQFMSDDILKAEEYGDDYLQSPVDDLYSYYYTMQWAAVFHDQGLAAKDAPIQLKRLREYFLKSRHERSSATLEIISPSSLDPLEYGSVLAHCQPILRAWYLELQGLKDDWKKCQSKLRGQETKAENYIPLFSTYAARGVATLADIVHKYTKDMAD